MVTCLCCLNSRTFSVNKAVLSALVADIVVKRDTLVFFA